MNIDELIVGETYRLQHSSNQFLLIREFDLNGRCFQRCHDDQLHYGREFIGFRDGRMVIELEGIDESPA